MDDFTGADISSAMTSGSDAGTPAPGAPAPTTETTTAPTGTGTTAPAAVSQPERPAGPIPFDVHKTALENARVKATEEWERQYGWAKQVPQSEFQQIQSLSRRLASANPDEAVAAVSELISEMTSKPSHAAAVRSLIAKSLGGGRGQQPLTMPEPDVEITDANGNVVGTSYSARALAARDAFIMQQVLAKVDEKYAPVVKTHEEVAAERTRLKEEAEANTFVSGFQQELTTYPGFTENKALVGQEVVRLLSAYAPNDPRTNEPAFLEALTLRAYNRVVVPKLNSAARQAVVQDQIVKAGTTGVVPGRAPIGAPKRSDDGRFTADDLKHEFAKRRLG